MALEFASKLQKVDKNPNVNVTTGVDLGNNPTGVTPANNDFIYLQSLTFKGNQAGALYVGTGGNVTVIPTKTKASTYYAFEFKNVPNGSFLPIAGKQISFTPISYIALDQELKSLTPTTSTSNQSPGAEGIVRTYSGEHRRSSAVLNNVKVKISVTDSGAIAAIRIAEVGTGNNARFSNLDFVADGDTIVVEDTAWGEAADLVITLTAAAIKTLGATTATDLIAYR